MRRPLSTALLVTGALFFAACPAPNPNSDGGTDGGQCVAPSGSEHERLLNAPTTANIVNKTPAVPEGAYP